jgi:hypothetical protein
MERIWESVFGRTGRRGAERSVERGLERIGERGAERIAERTAERAGERVLEGVGERAGLAAVERRALTASGKRIALKRLGRGALISVPALGSLFALWLCRADFMRAREEWNRQRSDLVWTMFIIAALADGVDAVSHFVIVYALFTETMGHHELALVESISLACAVISTLFAVGGELLSQLKILRAAKRREEEAGNQKIA